MCSMQNKAVLDKLSRLRAALRDALKELETTLEVAYERSALVKGNVYELARKCGKPTCACAQGQLHRSIVLSWSHQGKTRLMTIFPEQFGRLPVSAVVRTHAFPCDDAGGFEFPLFR